MNHLIYTQQITDKNHILRGNPNHLLKIPDNTTTSELKMGTLVKHNLPVDPVNSHETEQLMQKRT